MLIKLPPRVTVLVYRSPCRRERKPGVNKADTYTKKGKMKKEKRASESATLYEVVD